MTPQKYFLAFLIMASSTVNGEMTDEWSKLRSAPSAQIANVQALTEIKSILNIGMGSTLELWALIDQKTQKREVTDAMASIGGTNVGGGLLNEPFSPKFWI